MTLIKTPDILKALGGVKKPQQTLVGFALETENEKANALEKLKTKNTPNLKKFTNHLSSKINLSPL